MFAEDISLRDFLQTYIEGVERTMDYLSNELGVDRKGMCQMLFSVLVPSVQVLSELCGENGCYL